MADGLEASPPLCRGRDLGSCPAAAALRGGCGVCDRLGRQRRRDNHPRTSACDEHESSEPEHGGALSNYKNLPFGQVEPAGHGIRRSRGGWTTKIDHAVDRSGRPLAVVVTGGQSNDGAMLEQVLGDIRVPRHGGGRPRNRPDAVLADKAYSGGVIRRGLRTRVISAVIPEKSDQIAASKRRGYRGDRPPYWIPKPKKTVVVERSFALNEQWRGIATRYDKVAITYRAAAVLRVCITWTRK